MGWRNYLIEGVSGAGKTAVCTELERRGNHAIHGDRQLAYQGDPDTGKPTASHTHDNHIWDVEMVNALVADRNEPATFFCGGSRNWARFIGVFDAVFVLEVDRSTLMRRLEGRPADEFGGRPADRVTIARLHQTRAGIPTTGVRIDATAPLAQVVDEILRHCGEIETSSA